MFTHADAPQCKLHNWRRDGQQQADAIMTPIELERWPCQLFGSDCFIQLAFREWSKRASTEALCAKITDRKLLRRLSAAGTPPFASNASRSSAVPSSSGSHTLADTRLNFKPAARDMVLPPVGADQVPAHSRWRQCAVTSGLLPPTAVARKMAELIDEVDGPIIRPNALCMQVCTPRPQLLDRSISLLTPQLHVHSTRARPRKPTARARCALTDQIIRRLCPD